MHSLLIVSFPIQKKKPSKRLKKSCKADKQQHTQTNHFQDAVAVFITIQSVMISAGGNTSSHWKHQGNKTLVRPFQTEPK